MFNFDVANAYAQSRREALLREVTMARLIALQSRQAMPLTLRLALLMGNLFIALGTRLKAPYESAREAMAEHETIDILNDETLNYPLITAARR